MSTKVRGEARETMMLSVAQLSPAAQQMAKPANGKAAPGAAVVTLAAPPPAASAATATSAATSAATAGLERRGTGNLADGPLLNRELSWIEFNSRVLDEALDPTQPLLERLKFLSIFSTNLDEFFMVRVSGLREQVARAWSICRRTGIPPPRPWIW